MSFVQNIVRQITPFLKQRGFSKKRRTFQIVRNDVAYCIGFEAPSGILYVSVFIMPLYMPCDGVYYTYGNRMNAIREISLPIITKESDSKSIDQWCNMFYHCIDEEVLPFFDRLQTPRLMLNHVESITYGPDSFINCSELHLLRFRMYTYLYLGENSVLSDITMEYLSTLSHTTYLTDSVLQCYVSELEVICTLIRQGGEKIADYIAKTIQETISTCF